MFSGTRAADHKPSGAERRGEPRQAVRRRARLLVSDGGAGRACMILDVSSRGARVQTVTGSPPDGRVVLVDLEAGLGHDAEVSWIKGRDCGLRLLSTHALAGLVPRSMHRAKQVWAEAASPSASRSPTFGRLKGG